MLVIVFRTNVASADIFQWTFWIAEFLNPVQIQPKSTMATLPIYNYFILISLSIVLFDILVGTHPVCSYIFTRDLPFSYSSHHIGNPNTQINYKTIIYQLDAILNISRKRKIKKFSSTHIMLKGRIHFKNQYVFSGIKAIHQSHTNLTLL